MSTEPPPPVQWRARALVGAGIQVWRWNGEDVTGRLPADDIPIEVRNLPAVVTSLEQHTGRWFALPESAAGLLDAALEASLERVGVVPPVAGEEIETSSSTDAVVAVPATRTNGAPLQVATTVEVEVRPARAPTGQVRALPSWDSVFAKILAGEESREVELKSSLRWAYEQQEMGDYITEQVTKTIAAFLNSGGGYVVVGLKDDRTPVGLMADGFHKDGALDRDKWLRYLSDKAAKALGNGIWSNVLVGYVVCEGHDVAILEVRPSSEPVIAQTSKGEKLYIRRANSTIDLTLTEAILYLREHYNRSLQ
jgi:hypothetical protein